MVLTGAFLAFGLAPAQAAPISPSSYDMLNGNGRASAGTFNYWDLSYNGSGSPPPPTTRFCREAWAI